MLGFSGRLAEIDAASASLASLAGAVRAPLSWQRLSSRQGDRLLLIARSQDAIEANGNLVLSDARGLSSSVRLTELADVPDLIGSTDKAAILGVLRFIVAKATGILRQGDDSGLAETCHKLAALVAVPERTAQPVALCGHDMMMWALPAGVAGGNGTHYALSRRRLRRVPGTGGTVVLPDRRFEGGYLLPADGDGLIHLASATTRLPSLGDLGLRKDARSIALYRSGMGELARRAMADPEARRLLRDLQLMAPQEPPYHYAQPNRPFGAALEIALCDHAGGAFLRGWLRDPLEMIANLTLRSLYGEHKLVLADLGRFPRPDLAQKYADAQHGGVGMKPGFALHLPDVAVRPVAQWTLRMELTTGDVVDLVAPPAITQAQAARDAVLGSIAPQHITASLMDRCIAPAVERLHHTVIAGRGAPELVRIGDEITDPIASIVVPLYRNLRFLRHQFGAFARDRALRDVELIYVLDSPEQREDVEHLLRGLHGLYRVPLTLVVQAANYGYASACNAGAAEARAPVLLLLNSDVVPTNRGWLQPLLGALLRQPRLAAAGPKLLFEDGSLQHAGLFFEAGSGGQWFNNHYYKGYPRHYPPAQEGRLVPAITGAAICVRREAFEAVGGFCTDYIVGDYEDSDLCLKLRAAGGDIAYVPESELYHFERQSIRDHAGYARTLASTYNRDLHHRRWAAAIERLMARTERRALVRAR